uniref:Uncharacterized protein n=1 Tax=Knipowitschia caucasica TaxID=637954 RepID=A0AAV2K2U4_KNICA
MAAAPSAESAAETAGGRPACTHQETGTPTRGRRQRRAGAAQRGDRAQRRGREGEVEEEHVTRRDPQGTAGREDLARTAPAGKDNKKSNQPGTGSKSRGEEARRKRRGVGT